MRYKQTYLFQVKSKSKKIFATVLLFLFFLGVTTVLQVNITPFLV